MNELVSIVVNCYNGETFLRECLDSICAQDYRNWEIIFYDNCSTDDSRRIYEEYNDDRFRYFSTSETIPLYQARGEAMKLCNGEFIAFLDVDDIWVIQLSSNPTFADKGVVI